MQRRMGQRVQWLQKQSPRRYARGPGQPEFEAGAFPDRADLQAEACRLDKHESGRAESWQALTGLRHMAKTGVEVRTLWPSASARPMVHHRLMSSRDPSLSQGSTLSRKATSLAVT
jgi:hypothetical protein